ncbi:uncharacterized protein LOC113523245 isoform X1 [Galleria mellonella]|uniref:Uncharacterized protein LOC113523245 isoform X1 n=1 Tax=Galleria mellonella TaxID=7137 RepID=A0A6J1X9H4_GALME|nr:uncharacterized protein LOC113523245 isoform X1 [Galleria mellonella]
MSLDFFILFLVVTTVTCRHVQFYRKDYTYIEEFDAYYKLHVPSNNGTWNDAFFTCDKEDALLFYPDKPNEWTIVTNLTESAEQYNITDIFVGIHDNGAGEFMTVNGHSTPSPLINEAQLTAGQCVTMDIESGTLKIDNCVQQPDGMLKSFVCKKVEDVSCPTIDRNYIYYKETRKCYKINNHLQTWHEASHTCFMEGGLLVVVETNIEAEILKSLMTRYNHYLAGYKKITSDSGYYTLKGSTLSSNYERWYRNGGENDSQMCGSICNDDNFVYTVSVDCNDKHRSICQIDTQN